jgi:hypothetical protein
MSRINPPKFGGGLKFESDEDIDEKDSFRSGTKWKNEDITGGYYEF